ncbi:hypothetical protein Tco_0475813 [Tanacetum coccineum]
MKNIRFVIFFPYCRFIQRNQYSEKDELHQHVDASSLGGFYAVNRRGQVLLATVNESAIVPFVNEQTLPECVCWYSTLQGVSPSKNKQLEVEAAMWWTLHLQNGGTIINDGTASESITCFSPEARDFVLDCNEVVNRVSDKDPHHLPQAIYVALKKLKERCSIEDAMAVCKPGVLDQMMKWKSKNTIESKRRGSGSTSSCSGRSGTDDYVGCGGSSQYNSYGGVHGKTKEKWNNFFWIKLLWKKECRNDLHIPLRLSTQVGLLVITFWRYQTLDECLICEYRLTSRVRDELERLLDDDDDMADLYLSRKLFSASPVYIKPTRNSKAEADFLEVEQRVIDILKKIGRDPYSISKSVIKTFCKNVRNITLAFPPNRFSERQASSPSISNGLVFLVARDSTITHFLDELGLVDSSGPSMSTTSALVTVSHICSGTAKTGDGFQRGGVGVGIGINNNNGGSSAEATVFKNQHHQQGKNNHNNTGGYSYQRGGGVSLKNKSIGQWSNRRTC